MHIHRHTLGAFAAAALLVSAHTLRAQSDDPAAIVDRAVAAWKHVKSAQGTFTQSVQNALTGSSASSSGTFAEQRPNKLAIDFTNPSGDRVVADGHSLWIYTPSAVPGQVIRRNGSSTSDVPIDITAQLSGARARYDIASGGTTTLDGSAAHIVVLTPKSSDAGKTKVKVWVLDSDSTVRQFEIAESSGVTRRVHLTSLKLNAPIAKDTFTFTVPAGVKVVQ